MAYVPRVALPSLSDSKTVWKTYRRALDLYNTGATPHAISSETGIELKSIQSWIHYHWNDNRGAALAKQARQQIDLNKDKVTTIINEALELIATQITAYKNQFATSEGAVLLPVKDIKALADTARGLQSIVTAQNQKELAETMSADFVKEATIRGVADIARLLKQVDPDIDYERVMSND